VGPSRGLCRIPDGKGASVLFSCLELRDGSPHPCWLRTDHLAPMSKFDYVLARPNRNRYFMVVVGGRMM
jgi:hypothetical protein